MKELEVQDLERVADVSDLASNHEQAHNERCIDAVLSSKEATPEDFDGKHCVECGQEILPDRLKTGAFRDIHCQERVEHKRALYRRRK